MDGSHHLLRGLKNQASFFLKAKIKAARLAFTDVTPAQLLTEEAVAGDSLAIDAQTMRLISRAAFEVDDYCRIVDILHDRLSSFDERNWRGSYKALLLLEYLLTHGPQRIADEFQSDQDIITLMGQFNFVDERGFNWGLRVKRLSDRILKLIEDGSYYKEERERARRVTLGIMKASGSFSTRSSLQDDSCRMKYANADRFFMRSNSHFTDHHKEEGQVLAESNGQNSGNENPTMTRAAKRPVRFSGYFSGPAEDDFMEEDHPFCHENDQTRVSLLA